MEDGAQCVMKAGMPIVPKLCVNNSDMSHVSVKLSIAQNTLFHPPAYVPLSSHYVKSNTSLLFHLGSLECSGNEKTLKVCAHDGPGLEIDCLKGKGEAGVICGCKFEFMFSANKTKPLQSRNVLRMMLG